MLSFRLVLLAFCWSSTCYLCAQELPPPMVFGKVPKEDLAMNAFPADTAAAAVVLCDFGAAEVQQHPDRFKLRYFRHRRVKILKKSAFDEYGNVTVPFYAYQKKEEFFFDRGQVLRPNGEVVKLGKKDIFIEAKDDKWSVARFTFPQLEEGCIVEFSYFLNSDFFTTMPEWFFQEAVPVRWSEYRVSFPAMFVYTYFFQGNENMQFMQEKEGVQYFAGTNGSFRISPRRYVMENAPALRPEAYVTTMNDYRARIRFQLKEAHMPDGAVQQVMSSWKELQADLEHAPFFGEQFLKKSNYKQLAETVLPLAASLGSQAEKARFFYNYLTHNVEWNGAYSVGTRPEKLDDIFATKKASGSELNLMLLVLLREAGITAYPLLASTRSHGKMFEDYPMLDQFNHVFVFALPDALPLLLDATDPLRAPGYPSVQALNGRAWMMKPGGNPSWTDVKAPADAQDVYLVEAAVSETGELKGTLKGSYRGYSSLPERRGYQEDTKAEHWKKRLAEKYPDLVFDAVRFGNFADLEKPFSDTLDFTIPAAAQASGDFIYLSPVLYSSFQDNIFKQPERHYPVEIPYPFAEQHVAKLTLPPGWALEALPENANYALPKNGGSFQFAVEQKQEDVVHLTAKLQISQLKFSPADYQNVKKLFDLVAEKLGEQVVLKKKT